MNKQSILIIDDEELIHETLHDFLADYGFKVGVAETGNDALMQLRATNYQFALVDMTLPDMSGEELILKLHAEGIKTILVIHTGHINYTISDKLKNIGLSNAHIIHKPILDFEILLEKLKEL